MVYAHTLPPFNTAGDTYLYVCGSNKYGQLGLGHTFDSPLPVMVKTLENLCDVRFESSQ